MHWKAMQTTRGNNGQTTIEIPKGEIVSTDIDPGISQDPVYFLWKGTQLWVSLSQFKGDFSRMA